MIRECLGENISMLPIHYAKPVYGNVEYKFVNFLAPGMMSILAFTHAISITASAFVREKVSGTLERDYVCGMRSGSTISGHFLIHSLLLVVETAVMLLVADLLLGLYVKGPFVFALMLLTLLSFTGMSFG